MGIINVIVLLFLALGVIWTYLSLGMLWADKRDASEEGDQGLRQFFKVAVSGSLWPVAVLKWVWGKAVMAFKAVTSTGKR